MSLRSTKLAYERKRREKMERSLLTYTVHAKQTNHGRTDIARRKLLKQSLKFFLFLFLFLLKKLNESVANNMQKWENIFLRKPLRHARLSHHSKTLLLTGPKRDKIH